jgi:hypothetical protein
MARRLIGLGAGAVVALAALLATAGASAQGPLALDAQVVAIQPAVSTASYATLEYGNDARPDDDRTGTTTWRIVQGTGNCCENYLTISRGGRLLDFGGSYINYSDDRGATWRSVRPLEPLVNGEGTIAMAPGGDVVGVEWDPYSGDHLLAFKYTAATGRWQYKEMPLHQPFYDREWVSVVPGPFTIDGQVVPYLTFLKGGVPKEAWFYSTDGLTYQQVTSKFAERTVSGATTTLATAADAELDWIQPNTNGGMAPVGGRDLLAAGDLSLSWSLFDGAEQAWYGVTLADGSAPEGLYQTDSAGRLHNVVPHGTSFTYRWSSDSGSTWRSVDASLPEGNVIEEIDFRANKFAGVAAVIIHAQDTITGSDRDFLFKLGIKKDRPTLLRRYSVGLGDVNSTSGLGNDVRMDFQTVAIFPDGRVAVSFMDSTTGSNSPTTGARRTSPAIAVEGATKVSGPPGGTEEPQPVGVAPGPLSATLVVPAPGAGERVGGVTSAYLEFDVPPGADVARMSAHATPLTPADVDLYLQRQLVDGSWSGDLVSGTSGSLSEETLDSARLLAGSRYRIEAHLWAGAPATQIAMTATFYNSAGVPGT